MTPRPRWRTLLTGILIGIVIACAGKHVLDEIGIRRDTARRERVMEETWRQYRETAETTGEPS